MDPVNLFNQQETWMPLEGVAVADTDKVIVDF
jgi:hypothetical protein